VATVLAHGCSSRGIELCGALPDADACPVGRGGTCDDETCSSLYNCLDGRWVLVETCDQQVGGGGSTSSSVGGGGGGGAACNGVEVDRTGESQGCSPPLQEPDCPAAAAELCRPCETVCIDFFLCRDSGWEAVAHCDEGGNVVVDP
jgi:hypothetical protein